MKKTRFFAFALLGVFAVSLCGCSPTSTAKKASRNITNYSITASLNEDMELSGVEKVSVRNIYGAELGSLCFNLYGRAFREGASVHPWTSLNEGKCFPTGVNYGDMTVDWVKVEGKDAAFGYVGPDNNAVEVELDEILEPDARVTVELGFTLSLASCTHRLGYFEGSVNLGNFYPTLAVYEKGEFNLTPYYATGDPFYSTIANYDVNLTFPSEFNIASSGKLVSCKTAGGVSEAAIHGTAVRDFAIALTKEHSKMGRKVGSCQLTYVGYDGDENIKDCLDVAAKAVEFYGDAFGEYPYETLEVVKAPFVHGGMEYPGLVLISDSITEPQDIARVIAHEVAHQWWYGVVGNNEITEAWLDESLAEYSSVLFFEGHKEYGLTYEELTKEAFAGYVVYADIVSAMSGLINTSMLLPVWKYNGDYEYSYMIYVKGVLLFDEVRELVGKRKLEQGLKKYYLTYKFKVATTDGFIHTFTKVAGKGVDKVFDSWLSGAAIVGTI